MQWSRLYQLTRDAEATCNQVLANAKVMETQLSALRSEHELLRLETDALRRCLDRAGKWLCQMLLLLVKE